ncbi:MAG: beta family protein [Ginsengibacter sp.]
MKTEFYLPVLKSKQGEFDALFKLSDETKNSIIPLLEITPMEWDHATKAKPRTIEVHLQNFCKKVINKWPRNNAFIDTSLINDRQPNGVTCIEYIFRLLHEKNINPMPVVHINSPEDFIEGINMISLIYGINDIGVRVCINDITSPDFEDNMQELLDKIDLSPKACHMIFDLHNADFTNTDDFSDGIIQVLSGFPNFNEWKSFTVCGGSFPSTNLIKVGVNQIPRNEWKLYKELIKKLKIESFDRKLNYGDYSIVAPGHFEFDPTKMSRSANIRYTHDDIWYVVKGKALKKSEDFKQYVSQATGILNSIFYLGEKFSKGDEHIKKCSKGETTPGSPTVWNWIGNNHHFTKVVSDLFANYSAA